MKKEVAKILVNESLGRSIRILGQAGLAQQTHPDCDFTPRIEREINEIIDRLEKLLNLIGTI